MVAVRFVAHRVCCCVRAGARPVVVVSENLLADEVVALEGGPLHGQWSHAADWAACRLATQRTNVPGTPGEALACLRYVESDRTVTRRVGALGHRVDAVDLIMSARVWVWNPLHPVPWGATV